MVTYIKISIIRYSMNYNRDKAVSYAEKWALARNPKYFDFSLLGGDCTNFCSQSLYAGAGVMNDNLNIGWFYYSLDNRAPAWTGVEEFYKFITSNEKKGPYGEECSFNQIEKGDFISFGNNNGFYHMVIVTNFYNNEPIVCSHSFDRLNAPLSIYYYEKIRFIKILGVRK